MQVFHVLQKFREVEDLIKFYAEYETAIPNDLVTKCITNYLTEKITKAPKDIKVRLINNDIVMTCEQHKQQEKKNI